MRWTLHVPGSSDPWRMLRARPAVPPRVATTFWMIAIMASSMVLIPGPQGPAHWLAAGAAGLGVGLLLRWAWHRVGASSWRPGPDRVVRVMRTKDGIQILGWWHIALVRANSVESEGNEAILDATPRVHIRTGDGLRGHRRARILARLLESA